MFNILPSNNNSVCNRSRNNHDVLMETDESLSFKLYLLFCTNLNTLWVTDDETFFLSLFLCPCLNLFNIICHYDSKIWLKETLKTMLWLNKKNDLQYKEIFFITADSDGIVKLWRLENNLRLSSSRVTNLS